MISSHVARSEDNQYNYKKKTDDDNYCQFDYLGCCVLIVTRFVIIISSRLVCARAVRLIGLLNPILVILLPRIYILLVSLHFRTYFLIIIMRHFYIFISVFMVLWFLSVIFRWRGPLPSFGPAWALPSPLPHHHQNEKYSYQSPDCNSHALIL